MFKKLLVLFASIPQLLFAQQYNDFEFNLNLDVLIDTTQPGQIWQIGEPQKTVFNSAYTLPNALVTDTVNPYPVNTYAYCQFRADMSSLWAYPYFLITWQQKTDMEFGLDGGWMEASYDTGLNWVNVFMDTTFQPLVMGGPVLDTLVDGTIAFTGSDNQWRNVTICWGNSSGIPPFPINNVMDIRFVFRSDSINNPGDGWMIDNLQTFSGVVDFLGEKSKPLNFSVYPNPYSDIIHLNLLAEGQEELTVDLLDSQGRLVTTLYRSTTAQGFLDFDFSIEQYRPAFIRCTQGDRVGIQRLSSAK